MPRPPRRILRALRSDTRRDDAERHSLNAHAAGQTGRPPDDAVLFVGRTEPRARRDPLQGQPTRTPSRRLTSSVPEAPWLKLARPQKGSRGVALVEWIPFIHRSA